MALDAADAMLVPSRPVGVGRGVVILLVTRHVALRAHGVPFHAPCRPMPPLAAAGIRLTGFYLGAG